MVGKVPGTNLFILNVFSLFLFLFFLLPIFCLVLYYHQIYLLLLLDLRGRYEVFIIFFSVLILFKSQILIFLILLGQWIQITFEWPFLYCVYLLSINPLHKLLKGSIDDFFLVHIVSFIESLSFFSLYFVTCLLVKYNQVQAGFDEVRNKIPCFHLNRWFHFFTFESLRPCLVWTLLIFNFLWNQVQSILLMLLNCWFWLL